MVKFLKLYEKIGIFIFLVAGGVILSILSPYFLKEGTILNIIAQGTYGAIVGYGMTLAITSGGFTCLLMQLWHSQVYFYRFSFLL